MEYTLEKIYRLVGKTDQVANLTFKSDSEAFQKYGDSLTVVFVYDQNEREEMDKLIQFNQSSTHGRIKAKYLLFDLSANQTKQLLEEGINTEDITDIFYLPLAPKTNTFHATDKRVLNKILIDFEPFPKGGDLGWMYGFQKGRVQQGIGLPPYERNFYLAGKYYFEPQNLNEQENQEIFDEKGLMREAVEIEFLEMNRMREEINAEDLQKLEILINIKNINRLEILDSYLIQAGSSFKKLSEKNPEQAKELLSKVQWFNERRLNIRGKHPIYMNIENFLHIYMRHVEEFKVNQHFEHKDNFQWNEDDVFLVMENIIREIDNDYQNFRTENPDARYSKYGNQSIYFQGDYYTFHIDTTGRISTFYKNKKAHETKEK